ncbi:MAG TPA: outer membrane beta-barrel protein [Candidatus Limnocylindrales bacterium]|nr:outer membrane beta-barrel protein [Candidatus Limnocylindrales bacterium]
MKKRAWVFGSSLLGLALVLAARAQAADDIVVEGAPAGGVAVEGAAPGDPATGEKKAEEPEAKQRGFYAGGGVGWAFWEAEDNSDAYDPSFTVDDVGDDSDFLWTAFGGYRIAEWGGLEVGYTDLGGFSITDEDAGGVIGDEDDADVEANGIEARIRVWHDLGTPWVAGIGGIGVFIYDSDQDVSCRSAGVGTDCGLVGRSGRALSPREDSGEALTVSAGLQFRVHRNVLIRTEWQRYFDVLDQAVDTVQATVVVGFYDFFGQGEISGGGDFGGIIVE